MKKYLSNLSTMGQILFFILSSVRRDWSKVVVPIAVVGSWCKGWDKASPLFWSHSVKSGADPLFFLFIPQRLWWASFLLILPLKLPRASLDSPLSSFAPIYRCSYHKELQSKGSKRCGWGGAWGRRKFGSYMTFRRMWKIRIWGSRSTVGVGGNRMRNWLSWQRWRNVMVRVFP